MSRTEIILYTLIIYKVILLGIGYYSSKRTIDSADFFLGGKRLGPWVASISAVASASSAWTLLSLSGIAFSWGLSALWVFPGIMLGSILNWFFLAPKLQRLSTKNDSITVNDILVGSSEGFWRTAILVFSSFIIVFSFSFHIASQFQGAGTTFASNFNMDASVAIMLGGTIILIYAILGGFWAVSITDTLQGLLMVCTSIILPVTALFAAGGFSELWESLQNMGDANYRSIWGSQSGIAKYGLPLGFLGVGLATLGQPHILTRFMAIRDRSSMRQAQIIAISWQSIVFSGMLLLGFCGKALLVNLVNNESIFFILTDTLMPPILAGLIIASVLSAIMSTADSQLLVVASAIAHDLRHILKLDFLFKHQLLLLSRVVLILVCGIAMLLALYVPQDIYSRVLFAWSALGASFGPVLVIIVLDRIIKPSATFCAIFSGFSLKVFLSFMPNTPGDVLEKFLPFVIALSIGWYGSRKNINI